ncbi:DUF4244 domain-containing protein [Aquihabitans sp. McL0605]|uniref:DUF4244 domain-containing protein n=1 Tax=Aquihabitans sp. McL0605 TaxID=3415671 RepID=UPI003CF63E11
MLALIVRTTVATQTFIHRRLRPAGQRGQATAEYALVLLGAAAIALLLAAWAAKSGAISRLFDAVVDQLVDKAK